MSKAARQEVLAKRDLTIAHGHARARFSFSPCFSWVAGKPARSLSTVSTVSVAEGKTVETVNRIVAAPLPTQLKQGVNERRRLRRSAFCLLLAAHCLLLTVSCRQDMQNQPKAKPYRASAFFKDGQSSRPIVPGTVPRGWLRADTEFYTGKKSKTLGTAIPAGTGSAPVRAQNGPAGATQTTAVYPDDVDTFPFPITPDILKHGKERFEIFCSVCHGMTGNADGMVVRRGFRKPPSYHEQRLREAPVGHFFDVMTNGWGVMPSYASQIPAQDRWAIIAYIRALQLSQQGAQPATQTPPPAAPSKPTSGGAQR